MFHEGVKLRFSGFSSAEQEQMMGAKWLLREIKSLPPSGLTEQGACLHSLQREHRHLVCRPNTSKVCTSAASITKAAAHLVISAALDYPTLCGKKPSLFPSSAGPLEPSGFRTMSVEEVKPEQSGISLLWGTALWKGLWWSWGSGSQSISQQQKTSALTARVANCILGCINSNTASSSREVILSLCSVVIRPDLEYCMVLDPSTSWTGVSLVKGHQDG